MKTHRTRVLIPFGFALALLVMSQAIPAANRYGVIGLTNQTQVTIHYQFQVGNGSWQSRRLAPAERHWFSHEYDHANENRSPMFRIRFDSDARRGERFDISYKLERRAAIGQGYDYGKKYAFQYDRGDHRYIDLKAID